MRASMPAQPLRLLLPLLLAVAALASISVEAHALRIALEFMGGTAYNFDSTVTIAQQNQPELEFTGEFATHSTEQPIYWDLRLSLLGEDKRWAIDLLHHKLFLENPPEEVQSFSISHGYNMLTLQRIWDQRRSFWYLGVGAVIAHPETTVRGLSYDESGGLFGSGYSVAGPVVNGGFGWNLPLFGAVFFTIDGRMTISRVKIDIAEGDAQLSNVAFHLLIGVGIAP